MEAAVTGASWGEELEGREKRRGDGLRGKLSLGGGTAMSADEHPAPDHRQQQGPRRE